MTYFVHDHHAFNTGITDKCLSFIIDGGLAIKMIDYFNKEHPGSHSVRWNLELSWNYFDFVRRVPRLRADLATSNPLLMISFFFTTLCSGLLSFTTGYKTIPKSNRDVQTKLRHL